MPNGRSSTATEPGVPATPKIPNELGMSATGSGGTCSSTRNRSATSRGTSGADTLATRTATNAATAGTRMTGTDMVNLGAQCERAVYWRETTAALYVVDR